MIAEKPSVAMSLAAVLGATERKDGYLEGSGYLVSWCVGHLLELAQPEAYKEQYAKWRYEDLPILPENWKYEVPKDKKTQLALLCRSGCVSSFWQNPAANNLPRQFLHGCHPDDDKQQSACPRFHRTGRVNHCREWKTALFRRCL